MKFKPNHFHNLEKIREVKIRKDGKKFTIRDVRDRYFFPDEWMCFFDKLKPRQKITFNTLINTGARINEVRNVKPNDIDYERQSIAIRVTKTKYTDGTRKVRIVPISKQFTSFLKKTISQYNLGPDEPLPVLSTPAANIGMKKALREIKMPTQKWCNVGDCKEFTFTKLDDFDEIGWSAFQCPQGKGKAVCYCPKHRKQCVEDMKKVLLNSEHRMKDYKLEEGDKCPKCGDKIRLMEVTGKELRFECRYCGQIWVVDK